ncbi:NAD(+) hydrolase TcpC [Escherichia coli]|uniref:NAD(+) hydrolase TcpC n=1 Tax=Escherichia coli TaxID=562 RepID=UPI00298E4681|nr:NAD(+) hydrolase TcpC [Escherichia coli]MDW7685906.1 NAD(+) hydrolase TcpC [Escherichia coli]MDW7766518.1 NAD(+) hydrolase TcpC [Escherichia coli]
MIAYENIEFFICLVNVLGNNMYNILFFIFLSIAIPFLLFLAWKQHLKTKEIRSYLLKEGYNIIFNGEGNSYLAFNISNATFRAGNLTSDDYFQASISYIHDYRWEWKEVEAKKINNIFIIYISNIDFPSQKLFYRNNKSLAEIDWAKLQAIFHQPYEIQNDVMQDNNNTHYDFFISHAKEDKDTFVRPLVDELNRLGVIIWYDEQTLEVGDSLRRNIDLGLRKANYGIVILSHNFLNKKWTQYELDSLINRAVYDDNKIILPIWHNINAQEVSKYSHYLADKMALQTSLYSVKEIARELAEIAYRRR